MKKEYVKIPSSNNTHLLNAKIYIPNGEPIAIFQAVHGMSEHLERYDEFLSALCETGYVCIIHDHLGHGKTATDNSELGFIAAKNGWKLLVDDLYNVYKYVNNIYPNKKHFLLGHSMGSFITRLYAEYYGNTLSGYIMMGSGAGNPVASIGILLSKIIALFKGKHYKSEFIYNMAFGTYNKKFSEPSPFAWLSKDTLNIENYTNDPYCSFKFTLSAMGDLIRLNKECNRKKWFELLPEKLNIFIVSGSLDPVGDHSEGIKKVYNLLKKQNRYNLSLKLYTNYRHEILNDFCKYDVTQDIINWLDNILKEA